MVFVVLVLRGGQGDGGSRKEGSGPHVRVAAEPGRERERQR